MMKILAFFLAFIYSIVAFAPSRFSRYETSIDLFGKKTPAPAPPAAPSAPKSTFKLFPTSSPAPAPVKKTTTPAPVKKSAPAPVSSPIKSSFSLFPKTSSAPAVKKVSAPVKVSTPAKSSKSSGIDFTWGGRPNPTPETRVDPTPSFLSAPWRYNQKTK